MQSLIIGFVFLSVTAASALDRVEARRGSVSMSGHMTGATEFQFGVSVRGTLDQKIEQLARELRLLQFARDSFPTLLKEISYSGTNRPMSQCIADLSGRIGKPVPMELGTNSFMAKEFVFEGISLVDALKYLAAFNDSILDVSDGKLVCKPVRQALTLNESDYDLLHLMTKRQFGAAERILASKKVNVGKIQNQEGENLLHLAAGQNQTSIAKRLIALGVNINAKDNVGYTPLHEAVRSGNRECAEVLLKNGADTRIADNNNNTVLETALYYGFRDLAKMLVDSGATLDIFTASGLGLVDQVRKILDHEASRKAGQQNQGSQQPANQPIIGTHSTDPLPKGRHSYFGTYDVTPLHWAARGGSMEVASLLVSRGQSVSAKDGKGETPLFWAADGGRLEAAEFLVKQGADVNDTNGFASTPLLTAARTTVSPELMRFLIKAGADVNARDDGGENALHKLAWFGYPKKNVETGQMLLDAGADIAAKNKDGKTPLDVLLENSMRNGDLVKLYRKYADKKSSER